jgi:hypothetical protein
MRLRQVHELKTLDPYYKEVAQGKKTFEVRKFDRDFALGDYLHLREYNGQQYSGDSTIVQISYILTGGNFGIDKDYCVLGIKLSTF